MDYTITAIERGFQLAKSGSCASVSEIKDRLNAEGYSVAQITGPVLSAQLRSLIKAARANRPGDVTSIDGLQTSGEVSSATAAKKKNPGNAPGP
jgi:hypothetical protein